MDDITWQKAFNAGRAYQKLLNALEQCGDLSPFDNSADLETMKTVEAYIDEALTLLNGEE